MRITFTRNLVLGLVGAVGLVGSASARPDRDRVTPQIREGTPPPHIMNTDVMLRAAHDGRGETNAGDVGQAKRDPAFNTPDKQPFRDVLKTAGFYTEWKGKFGSEAWALLEKYTGTL